jgi:hypothetical protein
MQIKNIRIKLVFVFFFSLIIFRLPFLSFPLVGEEGTMSLLLLDSNSPSFNTTNPLINSEERSKSGKCQLLVAQSEQKYIEASPERNKIPYIFLCDIIGPTVNTIYPHVESLSGKTILSRLTFLSISIIGFIFIYLAVIEKLDNKKILPLLALVLIAISLFNSPLFVGGSIQPQLDGSIGLAIFCILVWATINDDNLKSKYSGFFSACLFALGKNEWAYALLVALILISIVRICIKKCYSKQLYRISYIDNLIYIYAGLMLAITLSFLYSQDDYLMWFGLAKRITDLSNTKALLTFTTNFLFLYPILIVGTLSVSIFFLNVSSGIYDEKSLFWILVGAIIFLAYLKSGWQGDGFPRYYIPAGVAFFGALLAGYKQLGVKLSSLISKILAPIFLLICFLNVITLFTSFTKYESITSKPGTNLYNFENNITHIRENSSKNEIYYFDSSIGYYFPEISFISSDLGIPGAEEMLRQKFSNKKLIIIQ